MVVIKHRAYASLALILVIGAAVDVWGDQRRTGRRRLSRLVTAQPESLPVPELAPSQPSLGQPSLGQPSLGQHLQRLPQKYYAAPRLGTEKYCINYKHHATIRRTCCGCCPRQKIVLDVLDPCHKLVAVPVSVPGCCLGRPHVSTGRDLLGRFSYTYQWRSGYKVDVVFRPRGDVMVHSWGR